MVTTLPGASRLRVPVTTPPSTRSMSASDSSSVCTPRSVWPARPLSSAFGIEPMPDWIVAPSGMRAAMNLAICSSTGLGSAGGTSTRGRSTSTQPLTWLTWSWLRPKVRGICWLASRKNGARPMSDDT